MVVATLQRPNMLPSRARGTGRAIAGFVVDNMEQEWTLLVPP